MSSAPAHWERIRYNPANGGGWFFKCRLCASLFHEREGHQCSQDSPLARREQMRIVGGSEWEGRHGAQ